MQKRFDFADDYEHTDPVEYILENVLMQDDESSEFKQLKEEHNSQLTLCCSCVDNFRSCKDADLCCHGGGYVNNDAHNELVLKQNANNKYPAIIECNDLCGCHFKKCVNRNVQYGPRKNLEIFNSALYTSKGLRTTVNIPCGAFICEYAGELLTLAEAKRRLEYIDKNGLMNYILCLHEYVNSNVLRCRQITTIVDPSRHGNIGRYLNHSCQPNCEILAVRINSPIPKIGIFANRDISANEELCFHYGGGEDFREALTEGKSCLCAAPNCLGIIPNSRI